MISGLAGEVLPKYNLRAKTILLTLALLLMLPGGVSLAGYLLLDQEARAERQADRCPADATAHVPDCYTLLRTTIEDRSVTQTPLRRFETLNLRLALSDEPVVIEGAVELPTVGKVVHVRRWREEIVLVWIDGQPLETAASPARQQRRWRSGTILLALGLVVLSIHNLLPAKVRRRKTTRDMGLSGRRGIL